MEKWSSVKYCTIFNLLDSRNIKFYTFWVQNGKGLKAMIKGVDSDVRGETNTQCNQSCQNNSNDPLTWNNIRYIL